MDPETDATAHADPSRRKADPLVGLEYKLMPVLPVTAVDERRVTGLFSVFGNVDHMDDIVEPGSCLKTFREYGRKALFLWQHDLSQPPIAVIDPEGLREIGRDDLPESVKTEYPEATGGAEVTRIYLDTPRGNEVLTAIHSGAPLQQSYGYKALQVRFETRADRRVRRIIEQRIPEISDVNFGANSATRAQKAWLDLPTLLGQLHDHLAAFAPPEGKAGKRHSAADQRLLDDCLHLLRQLGADDPAAPQAPEAPAEDEAEKSRAAAQALTQLKARLAIFDLETHLLTR